MNRQACLLLNCTNLFRNAPLFQSQFQPAGKPAYSHYLLVHFTGESHDGEQIHSEHQ